MPHWYDGRMFGKFPYCAGDGMFSCEPGSKCSYGIRCGRCEKRSVIYGDKDSWKFGSARKIPSHPYATKIRRNYIDWPFHKKYSHLKGLRETAISTMIASGEVIEAAFFSEGISRNNGTAYRRFLAGRDNPHLMRGLLSLMESWEYFLLSPIPGNGISKTTRGRASALARHIIVVQRKAFLIHSPIRYYGATKRLVIPVYLAAAEPYLCWMRRIMARNIVLLENKGEDWGRHSRG